MTRSPLITRFLTPALCFSLALSASCGGPGSPTAPGPAPAPGPGPTPGPGPAPSAGIVLMSGTLRLPAALDRGDVGEHQEYIVNRRLPEDLEPTSGRTLVIELRDATRPALICTDDEPEAGCATVDWSAEPGLPGVPANGLFINRLEVELAFGAVEYYLSRTLRLAAVPDLVDPTREHTAVGGSGRIWTAVLPANVEGDRNLRLRLVLTKWQPPDVEIAFEVRVVD